MLQPRERDACGVGFVAQVNGKASQRVLALALEALANHAHRGAVAADGRSGDGAGVMTGIPHAFFDRVFREIHGTGLPQQVAVGMVFLPLTRAGARSQCRRMLEESLRHFGLEPLGWRQVPVDLEAIGPRARSTRPHIQQIFIGPGSAADFERALYLARRRAERQAPDDFYVASLSSRTLVYKGLCMADKLGQFYPDLVQPDYVTSVALFHQRYSTNTFPTWHLAHPFRVICHNGEFNTLEGNRTWMRAREAALHGVDEDALDLTPVIQPGVSDSGAFDNVLEYFTKSGRPMLPSLLMMIPEMWENIPRGDMPEQWHDFYRYLSCLMEPWDGPAAVSFFDGRRVGTLLDRNGLRPVRYLTTDDGLVISASEAGCVALDDQRITKRGQLGPGEILVVDVEEGRIYDNHAIKTELAASRPYGEWVKERVEPIEEETFWGRSLSGGNLLSAPSQKEALQRRKLAFGYQHEEEVIVLGPMGSRGQEPVGSMGDDTPPAALSPYDRPLFHYFRQKFAQVTNPPIDPLRERLAMSLRTLLGRRANILTEKPESTRLLEVRGPILTRAAFEHLNGLDARQFPRIVLRSLWPVNGGPQALAQALDTLCREGEEAVRQGASILVLYDGEINPFRAPIPALLATSALHHHLADRGLRLQASLIVASGEPREVHHFAALLGYGADAVYPFLAYEALSELVGAGGKHFAGLTADEAQHNFVHAVEKGLLKVMARMGIALLPSYRGAQVFETLGLSPAVVDRWFPGTAASVGGVGLDSLARVSADWHARAYADEAKLPSTGFYKFKRDGEPHRFRPDVTKKMHAAVRAGQSLLQGAANPFEALRDGVPGYPEYAEAARAGGPYGLRDLLDFVRHRPPVALEHVEPLETIARRFSTGAMSHGSLSAEAHETLSVAMNRLGAWSNCGEGGEDPSRYGTERNSRIKQIASGRFGVTTPYLLSAEELQIKMAQGSKPGEGGQIPGAKVSAEIARIRHTTPGVALISPPPHHDIYSIEDLAQLVHDLKRVHPGATVSVKLVSEDGVGTVAAGVAKGFADTIHLSGCEGGTGASPLSSIKFAGMPWEPGLAEVQRILVHSGLRGAVRLRVDGGFQTGRDVLVAAILGADEFSFGTSALVAEGCLMARTCHTNDCPVGIATQDPALRKKYWGTPETVMAFMLGVAQEVRQLLATLGFRSLDEVIGCTELLEQVVFGEAAGHVDLSPLLWRPLDGEPTRHQGARNDSPVRGRDLDARLLQDGIPEEPVAVFNTDRTVGARIAGWACRHGNPAMTIRLKGTAGQSFGAFAVSGMTLELTGEANDYVGKSLSGGEIVVRPTPRPRPLSGPHNAIVGNTVLYGATAGKLLAAGRAGQRFAVRNSGATAVVEGVGEHACQYMTGGTVVVLGAIGRNFGAAMTGGEAFVYDLDGEVPAKVNGELVECARVQAEDARRLRALVEEHRDRTGSLWAAELLGRWEDSLSRFWRVAPRAAAARIEATNEGVADARVA